MGNMFLEIDCSMYTHENDSLQQCRWGVVLEYATFITYIVLFISLIVLILLKINRKNNHYVIIFSVLLCASVLLE